MTTENTDAGIRILTVTARATALAQSADALRVEISTLTNPYRNDMARDIDLAGLIGDLARLVADALATREDDGR